jgi:hypothetical protein
MQFEYIDLVDTIEKLQKLCNKLEISSILDGDAEQIEMISEIIARIKTLEVQRVDSFDLAQNSYQA